MIAARVTSIELHSERIQSMGISVRSPSDRPDRPDRISRPRNRRLFIAPAITAEIHFVISAPSTRIHLVILDSSPDPKLISNHFQIQILCCSFVLWPTLTGNCSASKSRFSGLLVFAITNPEIAAKSSKILEPVKKLCSFVCTEKWREH